MSRSILEPDVLIYLVPKDDKGWRAGWYVLVRQDEMMYWVLPRFPTQGKAYALPKSAYEVRHGPR